MAGRANDGWRKLRNGDVGGLFRSCLGRVVGKYKEEARLLSTAGLGVEFWSACLASPSDRARKSYIGQQPQAL